VLLLAACDGKAAGEHSNGRMLMASAKDELLRNAGAPLGKYYVNLKMLRAGPTSQAVLQSDAMRSADECEADITFWRSKGVDDGDRIFSYDFNDHPRAQKNTLPFSEMTAICKEYRPLFARYKVAYDLLQAEGMLARMREYLKPDDPVVTANMIAEYERLSNPVTCANALAQARKIDPAMKVGKRNLPLEVFSTEVAEPLATVAPKWIADARAAFRARNEKIAAPYVAAGIAGQKLDLIVSYGGVYWRLKGGERTDDPQKLARAAVLFQWLSAPDSDDPRFEINTVRRYEFKGNALARVTEKRYRRPEGANLNDAFD
jgi:hypothetical protein